MFLQLFSYDTRRKIQNFFNMLIQNEAIIENIRQRLNQRPFFDVYDAFRALDRNESGYLTPEDFKDILLDHGIISSPQELLNLLNRFDRDGDGRVSYKDFQNEIIPNSPPKK